MLIRSPSTAKLSPDAPAAGADHERGPVRGDLADLDRHELAGLVDPVRGRRPARRRPSGVRQQRAAALAVVGSLVVDEAALGAVQGHRAPAATPRREPVRVLAPSWREDVGQPLDVLAGDRDLAALVLVAQPVDQLGAQDVDLAVQDAPPVGDLGLLLGELADHVFQFDVVSEPRSGNVSSMVLSSPGLRRPAPGRGYAGDAGQAASIAQRSG